MRLTPAQRAAILRRYDSGEKIIAIAADYGISERWVVTIARRNGRAPRDAARQGRRKG